MGLIISRFRKSKTTIEVLERLEKEIKSFEEYGQSNEQRRKRILGYMMALSIGIYVLFSMIYYFMYMGTFRNWTELLFYASPFMLLPVVVIFLRATVSSYYNWILTRNRIKLSKMREKKKKLLEDVMNTETYKVAKEILDKFGNPDNVGNTAVRPFLPQSPLNNANSAAAATSNQLRQRQVALRTPTPNSNIVPVNSSTPLPNNRGPHLREQLPRPILERNRSALDRVVDFLLKDGPNYRMALICSECHSHNGMALEEEFEYFSYSCVYCGKFNPARKRRPTAPLLTYGTPTPCNAVGDGGAGKVAANSSEEEFSVLSSASDSENEKEVDSKGKKSPTENQSERPISPKNIEVN